jgi:excisionase family DNA binding protein
MSHLDGDPFLTTAEVAQLFRCGPKAVTRWANEGKLIGQRTPGGRDWRFRRSEVMRAMNAVQDDSNREGETDGDPQ